MDDDAQIRIGMIRALRRLPVTKSHIENDRKTILKLLTKGFSPLLSKEDSRRLAEESLSLYDSLLDMGLI